LNPTAAVGANVNKRNGGRAIPQGVAVTQTETRQSIATPEKMGAASSQTCVPMVKREAVLKKTVSPFEKTGVITITTVGYVKATPKADVPATENRPVGNNGSTLTPQASPLKKSSIPHSNLPRVQHQYTVTSTSPKQVPVTPSKNDKGLVSAGLNKPVDAAAPNSSFALDKKAIDAELKKSQEKIKVGGNPY
jgi:hypothetical protein